MNSEAMLKLIRPNVKKANQARRGSRDWSNFTPEERADNLEKLFRRFLSCARNEEKK